MRNIGVTKADDIRDVERTRQEQENLQAEQQRQMQAVKEFENTVQKLRDPGTADTAVAIASEARTIGFNSINLARETEARAMPVVIEQTGKAQVADSRLGDTRHNARVVSTLNDAVEDIHSGKQAREIQVSIQHEERHLTGIRDTSQRNAEELKRHTNQAVQLAHETASRVSNLMPD